MRGGDLDMKPRDAPKDFISDFETHADGNQNASCIFESDHVCSRGLIGDLGETRPTEKKKTTQRSME